jgi:hypothetical protein
MYALLPQIQATKVLRNEQTTRGVHLEQEELSIAEALDWCNIDWTKRWAFMINKTAT